MFTITATSVPVYNSVEKKTSERHWRQHPRGRQSKSSYIRFIGEIRR